MRITTKGQVTIPAHIRDAIGLLPHTEVDFHISKGRVYLEKVNQPSHRSQSLIQKMRGRSTVKMTTDEIMMLTRDKE